MHLDVLHNYRASRNVCFMHQLIFDYCAVFIDNEETKNNKECHRRIYENEHKIRLWAW